MNDYKKIYIVINDSNSEKQIDSIIVFKEDSAPVIVKRDDYNSKEYLTPLINLLRGKENSSNDALLSKLHEAIDAETITRVYTEDKKQMEMLQNELVEAELKYGNNTVEKEEKIQKQETMSEKEVNLLRDYFKERVELDRLIRLKGSEVLPPVGLNDIEAKTAKIKDLEENSEIVKELEEARRSLANGTITQKEYDKIYERNRIKFAEAVKHNSETVNEVMSKEAMSLVKEYLSERVQLDRLNRLANNGMLPPIGLNDIEEKTTKIQKLQQENDIVKELEEARANLMSGTITQKEYDEIYKTNREKFAEAVKYYSKTIEESISEDDKKLMKDYFKERVSLDRLNRLSDNETLPPVGLNAIEEKTAKIQELEEKNENVKELEEARRNLENGTITQKEYDEIYQNKRSLLTPNNDGKEKEDDIEMVFDEEINDDFDFSDNNAQIAAPYSNNQRGSANWTDRVYTPVKEETRNESRTEEKANPYSNNQRGSANWIDRVYTPVKEETRNESRTEEKANPYSNNQRGSANWIDRVYTPVKEETKTETKKETKTEEKAKPYSNNQRGSANWTDRVYTPVKEETKKETKTETKTEEKAKPYSNNQRGSANWTDRVYTPVKEETRKNDKKTKFNVSSPKNFRVDKKINPTIDEIEEVNTPSGTVKVKKTSKLKKLLQWVGGIALAGLSLLGIDTLIDKFKNKKEQVQHTQNQQNSNATTIDLNQNINNYCTSMNVPQDVQNFLHSEMVTKFLSQYTNETQLREVISALCDGYSNGILTREPNNFRRAEDADNFLRVFVDDFLCAKVIVNNYSPEQMLAVFGNSPVTAERIMDGYRSYYLTVLTYGTDAVKPWNFQYLTNNDPVSTKILDNLFGKLVVVNQNRKNGTLTSEHTDDFIAEVHKVYVQNDASLRATDGAKNIAAAIVESFVSMQAQVDNGEALYLHEDHGYAKAGMNLQAVDGRITIVSNDKTAYEFTNLFDIINHDFVDTDAIGYDDCLARLQLLNDNINEMNRLANGTLTNANMTLANILYQNNLAQYAIEVSKTNGVVPQELLDKIELANPSLSDEIDTYEQSVRTANSKYVPFTTTVDGAHEIFARLFNDNEYLKEDRNNNYVELINIRREKALDSKYEVVSGKRYVSGYEYGGYYGYGGISVPPPKVTVKVTREEVQYSDLTDTEREKVDELVEEHQQQEKEENERQIEEAQEVAQEIISAAQNGTITQEEANEKAEEVGMTLEPGIVEQLREMYVGTEVTEETDARIEEQNQQEQAAAEERNEQQRQENDAAVDELNALIQQGANLQTSSQPPVITPDLDFSSSDLVETSETERVEQNQTFSESENTSQEQHEEEVVVVTPDIDFSSTDLIEEMPPEEEKAVESAKQQLLGLKALADVLPEELGLDEMKQGYTKTKNFTA